jgi:hypothetical protein
MNIVEATRQYELWLAGQVEVVKADLDHKHEQMASGAFPFFRATFYRWMELWPDVCGELTDAPTVLSVGDLHVENFGTWRDQEGRLVWGVNDFDEAFLLPWTLDLVRLATSVCLAVENEHLSLGRREACNAILSGYEKALSTGGKSVVLAEEHDWLRRIALGTLRDPVKFWSKLEGLATWTGPISADAETVLREALPDPKGECRIAHRVAGLGSLGRQRFVALADWKGGKVAREAKALVASACSFALRQESKIYYQDILDTALRAPDPLLSIRERWIVRRLAPDCSRIELGDLPDCRDESRLLSMMGFETCNIHLGTASAQKQIMADFRKRPAEWLTNAAKRMAKSVVADWNAWRAC